MLDNPTDLWRRWAVTTAVLLVFAAGLPVTFVALVSLRIVEPGEGWSGVVLGWASAAALALMVGWLCWVWPIVRAIEPALHLSRNPRNYLRNLKGIVWTPMGFALLVTALALSGVRVGDMMINMALHSIAQAWPVKVIVGLVVCLAITWAAHRYVHQRFHRTIVRRRVCFHCGYDLRAATRAQCPECGAAHGLI